jgi:thioredoxin-related protein
MYPVLKELRKEGYIVYIYTLDTDEFEDLDLDVKFQIAAYPTFIFFDKGKETNRSIGKTTKDRITRYLVKEKDQPKPEPSPDPDVYDDL